MIIDTKPREITLDELKKKRENAKSAIEGFTSELDYIKQIGPEEIHEAEEIEKKLLKLKKFRKNDSKLKAKEKQQSRYDELDKTIKDMEKKGQTKILIK